MAVALEAEVDVVNAGDLIAAEAERYLDCVNTLRRESEGFLVSKEGRRADREPKWRSETDELRERTNQELYGIDHRPICPGCSEPCGQCEPVDLDEEDQR